MYRVTLPVGILLLGTGWTVAAEPAPAPKPAAPLPSATPAAPPAASPAPALNLKKFRAPGLGAPIARVDAATRGDGDSVSSLYVLAPRDLGFTTQAQPSLYWYQTKPAQLPFEFALLRPGVAKPVLSVRSSDGQHSGFQHLRLADHDVTLELGVQYQWVVALVRDPQSRSRDILSSGWIQRSAHPPTERAWYDQVEKLAEEIASHPGDRRLREQRASLLREEELETPAERSGG